jgi:hypothetical protein
MLKYEVWCKLLLRTNRQDSFSHPQLTRPGCCIPITDWQDGRPCGILSARSTITRRECCMYSSSSSLSSSLFCLRLNLGWVRLFSGRLIKLGCCHGICIPRCIAVISLEYFGCCSSLTSVAFESNAHLTEIQERALFGCASRTVLPVVSVLLLLHLMQDHHWLRFRKMFFGRMLHFSQFVSLRHSKRLKVQSSQSHQSQSKAEICFFVWRRISLCLLMSSQLFEVVIGSAIRTLSRFCSDLRISFPFMLGTWIDKHKEPPSNNFRNFE